MLLESTDLSTSQSESLRTPQIFSFHGIRWPIIIFYSPQKNSQKGEVKGWIFLGRVSYWWGGYGWDGRVNPGEVQSTAVSGDTPVPRMRNPICCGERRWVVWHHNIMTFQKLSCIVQLRNGWFCFILTIKNRGFRVTTCILGNANRHIYLHSIFGFLK